eukprot:CCRYP_007901-RA/>CCRYP_007901-RA protein AED:0.12 eAED:0.12 QI:0/-1/0/1/-1/1/1/0/163
MNSITHDSTLNNSTISSQLAKTVHFSTAGQVVTFESIRPTEEDMKEKWYNQEDKVSFIHNVGRDAADCIRMMARKAALLNSGAQEPISEEELAQCVGFENLLTHGVRGIMEMKKRHAWVVLREQALQRSANAQSEERLAHLASASSQWSREQSYNITVCYAAS